MDNYTLNDIKNLLENNMLDSEMLKHIFENTTRRIDLYDDNESIEILKLLSNEDAIPEGTKKEINKYLDKYFEFRENELKQNEEKIEKVDSKIVAIYVVLSVIIIALLIFIIK